MWARLAKAHVNPRRQRSQYTCMSTSMAMVLTALGKDTTEDEVNKTLGARPMRGASWEQAIACAQHYGMRATLICPSTIRQLKEYTDRGIPVMIAWNPEGRPWSHASVVFDVDDDLNVHVADPNIPDPDETIRVLTKKEFYDKWYEKWPDYMVRRPCLVLEHEVTPEGRQVFASTSRGQRPNLDLLLLKEAAFAGDLKGALKYAADLNGFLVVKDPTSYSTQEDILSEMGVSDFARYAIDTGWPRFRRENHTLYGLWDMGSATRDANHRLKNRPLSIQASESLLASMAFGVGVKVVEARSGLYGHTKRTQSVCEGAIRRLSKLARKMAKTLYTKDERTADFLKSHASRSGSVTAQILRAAMESMGPKSASEPDAPRTAARRRLGLYGYPEKTAKACLKACTELRGNASKIANDLHRKGSARHANITGFLSKHSEEGGCGYSSLLSRVYPDSGVRISSREIPKTIDEWLNW